jgi:hypothetical protein
MTNRNNFFKSASTYEGKIISRYKGQIEIQNKLLKTMSSALPAHLSDHALFCTISGKKIILYTDSATWSSQLRFYTKNLLQAILVSNRGNFEDIKIKIIPKIKEKEKQKPIKLPSSKNIDFIFNQAESQTDEKLKKALLNLGTTFSKLSKKNNKTGL